MGIEKVEGIVVVCGSIENDIVCNSTGKITDCWMVEEGWL
jgi:hypothetical protein